MKKRIGLYYSGYEQIELFVRGDTGGECEFCPEGAFPKIIVGIDYDYWKEVLGVLMHEINELQFFRMNCRYAPDAYAATSSGRFVFHCTHEEFSEIMDRSAEFVAECQRKLYKAWEARKKERKKKNAKKRSNS